MKPEKTMTPIPCDQTVNVFGCPLPYCDIATLDDLHDPPTNPVCTRHKGECRHHVPVYAPITPEDRASRGPLTDDQIKQLADVAAAAADEWGWTEVRDSGSDLQDAIAEAIAAWNRRVSIDEKGEE